MIITLAEEFIMQFTFLGRIITKSINFAVPMEKKTKHL